MEPAPSGLQARCLWRTVLGTSFGTFCLRVPNPMAALSPA